MEKRNIEFIPKCIAIGFKRKSNSGKQIFGDDLFKKFVDTNNYCYWNINLKEVFDKCELVGHIQPYCLLISAPDIFIQSIKLAHQKRLLKAPESFVIHFVGDVDPVNCTSINPSQFVSLDEALCYVIFDLNLRSEPSAFDLICSRLAEWYPGMQLPPQFLILATLRNLIESGQVYYTGYGYNIMTTDKMFVAQWLGDQGPEKAVPRTSSVSDMSVAEKTVVHQRSKSDRVEDSRIYKTLDRMPFSGNYQNQNICIAPLDENIKRTKTRSAVRQFFSKLRPKSHKSHLSSNVATLPNDDSIYDDESNYYAFCRSQPRFYSSNLEFSPRFNMTTPVSMKSLKNDDEVPPKPQWLWRTSLQSLPNNANTIRRSSSSHSRLSTMAIHDESPRPGTSTSRRSHRSKSKSGGRHRSKSKHRSSSRDKCDTYGVVDPVQEDSGVHSITLSDGTAQYYPYQTQHQSTSIRAPLAQDERLTTTNTDGSITPSTIRPRERTHQRLSRSFSTRLSGISTIKGLDPVMETSRWSNRDDKHVAFKDPFGTAY